MIIAKAAALLGSRKTGHIAAGFGWGLLLAFIPTGSFFWVLLLVISFFFRHNHIIKLLVMVLFKLLLLPAAPLVDALGWGVLHIGALQGWFTTLYNMPFVPFTRFNNTMVAGGLAGGLAAGILSYILVYALVPPLRNKVTASSWFRSLSRSPLFAAAFEPVASEEADASAGSSPADIAASPPKATGETSPEAAASAVPESPAPTETSPADKASGAEAAGATGKEEQQ
jgi:uncharacterized protein (TIGR03546 family)